MIKRIVAQNKKITDIASEWDSVAYKRKMAISSGADRSFQNILLPEILLKISGFSITGFEELYSEKSRGMDNFRYPRFVYIEAEKTSS